jgi:phosphohistidine phosphatase SixA
MRPLALFLALLFALPAAADEDAAWTALREGGHVALMRHAEAPGTGDPPGFRLDDCATQRNLSERGRADAARAGARLKEAGIEIGRLASSPWCRCRDTAELLGLGPVEIEENFANAFILRDRRDALAEGARRVIGEWHGPGTLFVVTHGSNISALTGRHPGSGEIVVVAGGDPAISEIGRIPVPR